MPLSTIFQLYCDGQFISQDFGWIMTIKQGFLKL